MEAKEYKNLQLANKKVNRDNAFHFKFENEQEYVDYLIKDAIRSMIEKVKKTGTSQDPEEWTDPPEYSQPGVRKDFVMVIVKFRKKFRGLARSMDNQFDLKTDWFDDMNSAGQQIVKYIDLFRKQTKMARFDEIDEMQAKRKRIADLKKSVITN